MSRLDPRTRIVIIVAISAAAMFTDRIPYLLGLLAFTVAAMIAEGTGFGRIWRQLTGAVSIVAFIFVLQTLFGQFALGAMLAIRLLIIIMSALILLAGAPRDYLLAMIQCRMPYELAYMVILAFHFFPILREESQDVYYSIQLRGTELKHVSVMKKLTAFRKMCIPILASAMERAKDTSIAMEARGFRAKKKRTYMRKLKLKKKDIAVMITMPVLTVAFLLMAGCSGGNTAIEGYQATLSMTGSGCVSISWSSDEKYDGIAECGDMTEKADVEEISRGRYYRYSAEFTGLENDKKYTYSVGEKGNMSNEGSFRLDWNTDDFAFLFSGDVQYQLRDRDYETWGNFMKTVYDNNKDASFMIMAGDMVEKGPDPEDWKCFFFNGEYVFSRMPVMTTVGNHETSRVPDTYLKMMSLPQNGPVSEEFYSFDYGGCHFVSLNSCFLMPERRSDKDYEKKLAKVEQWLEKDLKNSNAKWKFVYMHHPMYPVADDSKLYGQLRENWEDLFKESGVDVVLYGHQHAYMRTVKIKGITYVMANSGEKRSYYIDENTQIPDYVEKLYEDDANYVRVDVSDEKIEMEAYNKEGQVTDSCTVK